METTIETQLSRPADNRTGAVLDLSSSAGRFLFQDHEAGRFYNMVRISAGRDAYRTLSQQKAAHDLVNAVARARAAERNRRIARVMEYIKTTKGDARGTAKRLLKIEVKG
jgi:hypothetical protein